MAEDTIVQCTTKFGFVPSDELREDLWSVSRDVARIKNMVRDRCYMYDAAMHRGSGLQSRKNKWGLAKRTIDGKKLYRRARDLAPTVAAPVANHALRSAVTDWKADRWNVLVRQDRAPRYYKSPQPVRAQNCAWFCTDNNRRGVRHLGGDRFEVSVRLLAEGHGERVVVPLKPKDRRQRKELMNLATGEWQFCEGFFTADRRGRWYFQASYKMPRPPLRKGGAAGLDVGVRNMFALVVDDGTKLSVSGDDLLDRQRKYHARLRSLGSSFNVSGRRGRGRKVALRPREKLSGSYHRYVGDKLRQYAAAVVEAMVARGATTLYMEDLVGIKDRAQKSDMPKHLRKLISSFPMYILQEKIKNACARAGIECVKVNAHYTSITCPECGEVSSENRPEGARKFECVSCGHTEDSDVVGARNVLARGLSQSGAEATEITELIQSP